MRITLYALLILLCVLPVSAETLTGEARIIDADTVEIAGEKLRLEGIAAPESRQTCKRDGKRHGYCQVKQNPPVLRKGASESEIWNQ